MKQNRYLPFGYIVRNGKIMPNEPEVAEIKRIYSDYLSGKSYLTIAADLTQRQVYYLEKRCNWNRNRVKRILECDKYLGTDMLPAIISEQEYQAVQTLIQSKTANYRETPQDMIKLRGFLYCKSCGMTLKRYIANGSDTWRCGNKACRVSMNHRVLTQKLDELLQYLITNRDHISSTGGKESTITDAEVECLQSAFKAELGAPILDEEKAKGFIFSCAVAEYNRMDDGTAVLAQVIKDCLEWAPHDMTALDRILEIASKVFVTREKDLQAELKTGQLIPSLAERSYENADHSDGQPPLSANHPGNQAAPPR